MVRMLGRSGRVGYSVGLASRWSWARILLRQLRFGILAILSEETLNIVGPFYRVSVPGEVKYPIQGIDV